MVLLRQPGQSSAEQVPWEPFHGGILVQGMPRLRLWLGRHDQELRAEIEPVPELDYDPDREFLSRFFMHRIGIRHLPEGWVERPVPPEWERKTLDDAWDATAGRQHAATDADRTPRATPAAPADDLVAEVAESGQQVLGEKSLERLREMLSTGSSPGQKRLALDRIRRSAPAGLDRDQLRPLVLPLLKSEDARIRKLALQCLPALKAASPDLELVVTMAGDVSSEVRTNVGSALIALGQGDYPEHVVPALTELLNDSDPKVVDHTIRSMWGQYSSPEFDELLIQLSRNPRHHHNAIYFCLSTMRSKSIPVCRRLIEELDDPDWNNSGRAAWGLTRGVVEDAKPLVEDGLLKALPEEKHEYTRNQEFRALRGVATENSRPFLTAVVDSETETEKSKELARAILADLDSRR
ncbi:MAG: hypothetical protein JSV91_02405 [Phycisphaerales bacterium]|nr:MAG: hypothetical protein JSV91_02405 [Phycisphaerales bacterium]